MKSSSAIRKRRERSRYTLDELLAHCNSRAARTQEDREWLGGKPVGRELI